MDLHPPFSAFPIALFSSVVILEIWHFLSKDRALRQKLSFAIRVNLCIALIGLGAAFYTGYGAHESASKTFAVSDDLIAEHHRLGRLLLFCAFPCVALGFCRSFATQHQKVFAVAYTLFLIICFALTLLTGLRGGELVFDHGAGVAAPVKLE